jgi:ketosteroid isomerase-like protein
MKTKTPCIVLALGLCVLLSACQKPAVTGLSDEDEAAIRKVMDEAMVLGNAAEKDFTAYVKHYYADDGTVMAPNMPAVTGQTALVSFFEEFPPYEDFLTEILEIDGLGDFAYVRGAYSMNIMMPGSETPVHDSGKYVEVWKKQADGAWKVYLDCFNSDLPLPSPEMETEK